MSVAPLPKGEHEPIALCGYSKGARNEVALENFKGLLQDGGRANIETAYRASPFYKDQIHLAGQHL
jgi:hypothetical protein